MKARDAKSKAARREAILEAASRLLRERPSDEITVAAVAERAGLAKGTVYLYVRTREELFLALTQHRIDEWLDALDARLPKLRAGAGGDAVARILSETLAPRRELLTLLRDLHAVFERNVEPEAVLGFKRALLARCVRTGGELERTVRLPAGEGTRALLRIHALVVGLWQMADASPAVARALADPGLRALRIDFRSELETAASALLDGLSARTRRRTR